MMRKGKFNGKGGQKAGAGREEKAYGRSLCQYVPGVAGGWATLSGGRREEAKNEERGRMT